jgi:uncharacterized protein YggU (UPF0235/DUF167 family)
MARHVNRLPKTAPAEARLALKVQPGSKRSEVLGLVDGVLRVRVAARAQEGKANDALIDLLAALLVLPKGRIRILRGLAARDKVVAVRGLSQEEALRRLGAG